MTDNAIGVELSQDMSTEGCYAVVRGDERFHPIHEDPEERQRFLDFFSGLELGQKVRIVEGINRPELLEALRGVHPSEMERHLDNRLAAWIEENERSVQYRDGSLARMRGEQERLTGDEHPFFKEGFRNRLVKELRDPSSRLEPFGDFEASLARLWESSKHVSKSSVERARRSSWPYLTVRKAPEEGRPPEWVRQAWEDVSIPVPPMKDGSRQEPAVHAEASTLDSSGRTPRPVLEVWVDDAILALCADGKRQAAGWWMDHYETFHGNVLQFPAGDCEAHAGPGPDQ